MLMNNATFINMPIGSVRSSGRIGLVTGLVINPHNLHIDALKCRVARSKEQLLSPMDIRDISSMGVVINDHDNLLDIEDAVRLEPILKLSFELINKMAYEGRKKIGKVEGFAVNSENMFIQKIYVRPGLIARVSTERLTYDRSAIKEVTDTKVVFESSNKIKGRVASSVENIKNITIPQPSANASLTSENK